MRLKSYFKEAFNELFHKVSWPSWAELQDSTIVVMIASALIIAFIGVCHGFFLSAWVMQAIYWYVLIIYAVRIENHERIRKKSGMFLEL